MGSVCRELPTAYLRRLNPNPLHAVLFAPLRALFWLVGSLPYPLLYALSDGLALVLHRVLGYRKAVIQGQLEACFPDKDEAWRRKTAAAFYRHLSDLIVEAFKFPRMSRAERFDRIQIDGLEHMAPYGAAGRSSIIALGHLGNWEWGASGAERLLPHGIRLQGVYKKPTNPSLDAWLKRTRARHGMGLVGMKEVDAFCQERTDAYRAYRASGKDRLTGEEPFALVLIADQSPSNPRRSVWTEFMGRETSVFYGPERLARKFEMPVFYFESVRTGRGRYTFTISPLVMEPLEVEEGAITKAYLRRLEEGIRREPAHWLWSHKRWKHRKPEGANELD